MKQNHTSRKDTYRPAFCSSQFYIDNEKKFSIVEKKINSTESNLSQNEIIIVWIIICSCLRRSTNWFSGFNKNLSFQNINQNKKSIFSLSDLFLAVDITWPAQLDKNISLDQFCGVVRIAPLPLAAMNSLYYFLNKKYPLEILCYEPSPFELLKFQIQGKRVLTFDSNYKNWANLKYGERDPLSFWLHDLIHAEHFFSDSIKRQGQIGFYRFIDNILSNKILDDILLSCEFNKSFSYLISDMNSHPIHLIKTFKALIDIHESVTTTITEANFKVKAETEVETIWNQILNQDSLYHNIKNNSEIIQILKSVNTINFNNDDALKLTSYFNQLSNQSILESKIEEESILI